MTIVFASTNKNKISEIKQLLSASIKLLSLEDIGCFEDIPETAETIEGNAIFKANYVSKKYGYNCFADDTGLEVGALNGAPGVYSARYAGEQKNADDNMNKLLESLKNKNNRDAQFKTIIALRINNEQHLFEGIVKGKIIEEKKGAKGFGYDPIFVPEGFDKTFAEMEMSEKAALSHRGIATRKLIAFLENI
ncbi:non-canonical purine NTP diphosphatase [Flavobacterium sp.]|uniref:non-canonical purine NTP diphosphatase n=1 Tax=Flavobacterium sp. TaxID=239 RepID=UPI00352943BC